MKYLLLTLIFLFVFSCTICSVAQPKDSLYRLNNVQTVVYQSEYARIVTAINRNGLVEQEVTHSPNDSSIRIPKYDNSGLRISDSIYYFLSKKFANYSSKYDENNKYLGSAIITNDGNENGEISITETKVLYDSLGNIYGSVTYRNNYMDTVVSYFKYIDHYENGYLVYKECECNPKSVYYPIMTDIKFYYNDNLITKREQYSKNCIENYSNLYSTETLIYYENGLLKESITKYELDVPVSTVRYEYSFYK